MEKMAEITGYTSLFQKWYPHFSCYPRNEREGQRPEICNFLAYCVLDLFSCLNQACLYSLDPQMGIPEDTNPHWRLRLESQPLHALRRIMM